MPEDMTQALTLESSGEAPPQRQAATALAPDTKLLSPARHGVHHAAFYLFAGLYVGMMLLFLLTFMGSAPTVFAIGICIVYGLLFFGTPLVLYRVSGQSPDGRGWADFLNDKVETNTGVISGWAALVQICIVPASLLPIIAFIGILVTLYR